MIRFHFEIDTNGTIPYSACVTSEGTLMVINLALLASMPVWLREHLANEVAVALDSDGRPSSEVPNNVIDITDARIARSIRQSLARAASIGG